MNFRDALRADVTDAFLDLDEFGEEHTINEAVVTAIIEDLTSPHAGQVQDGMADAATLGLAATVRILRIADDALDCWPVPGQRLDVDGDYWTVDKVSPQMGLLEITILQPFS